MAEAKLLMPAKPTAFTDFCTSADHILRMAANGGRTPQPAWATLPVAYNGRASSVAVSGTPVIRPVGQIVPRGANEMTVAPEPMLDFELEFGAWLGGPVNALGETVDMTRADELLFGCCLVNDWSARGIQFYEMLLGPHLGKSFLTTISPWVVTMEALAPFRVAARGRTADQPDVPTSTLTPRSMAARTTSIETAGTEASTTRSAPSSSDSSERDDSTVVVLVGRVHRGVLKALRYSKSLRPNHLAAVYVAYEDDDTSKIEQQWRDFGIDVPLEIVHSPYRELVDAVVGYLDELDDRWGDATTTVVIPEFVVAHWYEQALHNQSALAIKVALLRRENTVVTSVPLTATRVPTASPSSLQRSGLAASADTDAAGCGMLSKKLLVCLAKKALSANTPPKTTSTPTSIRTQRSIGRGDEP